MVRGHCRVLYTDNRQTKTELVHLLGDLFNLYPE